MRYVTGSTQQPTPAITSRLAMIKNRLMQSGMNARSAFPENAISYGQLFAAAKAKAPEGSLANTTTPWTPTVTNPLNRMPKDGHEKDWYDSAVAQLKRSGLHSVHEPTFIATFWVERDCLLMRSTSRETGHSLVVHSEQPPTPCLIRRLLGTAAVLIE
jgi:hypothetical protein